MEGILEILDVLFLLLWIEGVLDFYQLFTSLFELLDKSLYLFLASHQSSHLADPF